MTQNLKIAGIAFLVLSAIGFLDTAYLTIEHYRGSIPPCTIQGCEIVLRSQYSRIAGIPVALLGLLYYSALLILSAAYLSGKKKVLLRLASYCTIAGVIASAYFVYLQLFVIKEICQYCMVSAADSAFLFVLGMCILMKTKKEKVEL